MESFSNFQATKEFKWSNDEETHTTLVIANNIFHNDIKTKTIYL